MNRHLRGKTNHSGTVSRRGFLRGLGACVALPFLESVAGSRPLMAQTLTPVPQRFFAFFAPNGMNMLEWTPNGFGSNFEFSSTLRPLETLRSDVLVLSGLENKAGMPQGDGPGDHARGTGTFLTCAHPSKVGIRNGVSLDQVLAKSIGADTRLSSMELGVEQSRQAGTCDSGYACAYNQNISWASAATPRAKEINPRLVFNRLFSGADAALTVEQIEKRKQSDLSILDFVKSDIDRLKPQLGNRDQHKLDEYFTGIRELEKQIQAIDPNDRCEMMDTPMGIPDDLDLHVRQLLDLAVIAFQCDISRVGTFMFGNGATGRNFPHLDIRSAHHELSHHQNDPEKLSALARVNRWQVECFAYFLEKLKSIEEPNAQGEMSNALHNSVVLFGSELADPNSHQHTNKPCVIGGSGGGGLNQGQHLVLPNETPMADLYLTILNVLGCPETQFGDDGTALLSDVMTS